MDITEIVKDSFNYAKQDLNKLLIVGILCLLSSLNTIILSLGLKISGIVSFVLFIVMLVAMLCLYGYDLNIIRSTLNNSSELPNFNLEKDIMGGIKLFIVNFVYCLFIGVILVIAAFLTGLVNFFVKAAQYAIVNPTLTSLPPELINQALTSFLAFGLIILILGILFTFIYIIAMARLAKYNSITEGLNIFAIVRDIKSIGYIKFFISIIVLILCIVVFFIILILLSLIPYIGFIIGALVILSFANIFNSRAFGLLYGEVKEKNTVENSKDNSDYFNLNSEPNDVVSNSKHEYSKDSKTDILGDDSENIVNSEFNESEVVTNEFIGKDEIITKKSKGSKTSKESEYYKLDDD